MFSWVRTNIHGQMGAGTRQPLGEKKNKKTNKKKAGLFVGVGLSCDRMEKRLWQLLHLASSEPDRAARCRNKWQPTAGRCYENRASSWRRRTASAPVACGLCELIGSLKRTSVLASVCGWGGGWGVKGTRRTEGNRRLRLRRPCLTTKARKDGFHFWLLVSFPWN